MQIQTGILPLLQSPGVGGMLPETQLKKVGKVRHNWGGCTYGWSTPKAPAGTPAAFSQHCLQPLVALKQVTVLSIAKLPRAWL